MFASTNGDEEVRMDRAARKVCPEWGDREKSVPTPEISTINERRNIIEKNNLHGVLKVKNEMVLCYSNKAKYWIVDYGVVPNSQN